MLLKVFGFLLCWMVSASLAGEPDAVAMAGAKQIFLVDYDTGRVLLEKNADERISPSSMTKILTVMLVFERLKKDRLKLSDTLLVSPRAWQQEGSRMFLNPNTLVSIDDLLKGIVIQSGNDATSVIAEGLSSSEAQFANEMTAFAKELGATNSHFTNASGLPEEQHYTTARDLALLGAALIRRYPEFYPMFSVQEFTYNNIRQGNRNPLLYKKGVPVDGIKTGMSSTGGYGIVASGEVNGLRLILVLNGMESMNARSQIADSLLSWGFREFKKYKLASKGQVLASADVWLGVEGQVPLVLQNDISVLMSFKEYDQLKTKIVYQNPVEAPVQAGQILGKLVVEMPGQKPLEYPLVAGKAVEEVGVFKRVLSAVNHVIWGSSKV